MGILQKARKLAVREAGYLVHAEYIAFGYRVVKKNLRRMTAVGCPLCAAGQLHKFSHQIEDKQVDFLGCSHCSYFEFAEAEEKTKSEVLARVAAERIKDLPPGEYVRRLSRLRWLSRGCYLVALLLLVASWPWWYFTGQAIVGLLYLPMLALFAALQGLVSAYRYVQFRKQSFYVPGAFVTWVKSGDLFV